MPEGYASFKLSNGMVVSTKKFKNHDEVADWVSAEVKARKIKASDIRGKPAWPVGKNGT